jgi:phosphoglycerate dehydrogenase-like enzyme
MLCAGITTYSPMRHWSVTKGKKVGVVGLGGLGHVGVKIAHALGAHVVVFTSAAWPRSAPLSPKFKRGDLAAVGCMVDFVPRNTWVDGGHRVFHSFRTWWISV